MWVFLRAARSAIWSEHETDALAILADDIRDLAAHQPAVAFAPLIKVPRPTGVWSVFGRSGPHIPDGFFIHMMDSNRQSAGSIICHALPAGGPRRGRGSVGAAPEPSVWLNTRLQGRSWDEARHASAPRARRRPSFASPGRSPGNARRTSRRWPTSSDAAFRAFDRSRRSYGS